MTSSMVVMGCSEEDQSMRREARNHHCGCEQNKVEMSGRNGGGGGGGGVSRGRKMKAGDLSAAQKKKKQPQRGMGVEQLERIRVQGNLQPLMPLSTSAYGGGEGFCSVAPPALFSAGGGYVVDPTSAVGIGSGSGLGYQVESSHIRELSSIPNMKFCCSDGCAVHHKKIRINGEQNLGFLERNHTFAEMVAAGNGFGSNCQGNNNGDFILDHGGKQYLISNSNLCKEQEAVPEIMAVQGKRGTSVREFDFFPGKNGGSESSMVAGTAAAANNNNVYKGGSNLGFNYLPALKECSSAGFSCHSTHETTAEHPAGGGYAEGSTSIDLSLRLSSY